MNEYLDTSSSQTSYYNISIKEPGSIENDKYKTAILRTNVFFPIFAEILRVVSFPRIVGTISFLYQLFQNICIASFFSSPIIYPKLCSKLQLVYSFADWGILYSTKSLSSILQIYFLLSVCLLIISASIVFFCIYYSQRKISSFAAHFLAFSHSYLNPILLMPLGSTITKSFQVGIDSSSIISFVLIITFTIIAICIGTLNTRCFCILYATPVLNPNTIFWSSDLIRVQMYKIFFSSFLQFFLGNFPSWMTYIFLIFYICIELYEFKLCFYLIFLRIHMNVQHMSHIISLFSSFILLLLNHFHLYEINENNWYITLLIPISINLILFPFVYKITSIRNRSTIQKLQYSSIHQGPTYTDKEKMDYLYSLEFKSTMEIEYYLRVGLIHQCQMFIDFSFLQSLSENYVREDVLISIATTLSYFPSKKSFFSWCIHMLETSTNLTHEQEFFLYLMRRVYNSREYSLTSEAKQEKELVLKVSKNAISSVRGFWGEIVNNKGKPINFASFQKIFTITKTVDTLYKDAIEKFPNSADIISDYVRFLIECCGNFSNAIIMQSRYLSLKKNQQNFNDYSYHSFVNLFPDYITKDILDSRGNLKSENKNSLYPDNYSSNSFSDSFLNNKKNIDDEITNDLFDHGKFRLALQTTLNNMHQKIGIPLYILSGGQLLANFVIFLYLLLYLPFKFSQTTESIHQILYLSDISTKLNLLSSVFIIEYAKTTSKFSGFSNLISLLHLSQAEYNSLDTNSIFLNPLEKSNQSFFDLFKSEKKLYSTFQSNFSNYQNLFDNYFGNKHFSYQLGSSGNAHNFQTTLQQAIIQLTFWAIPISQFFQAGQLNDAQIQILNNFFNNSIQISTKTIKILKNTTIAAKNDITIVDLQAKVLTLVIVFASYFVYLILWFFFLFHYYQKMNQFSGIFQSASEDEVKASYNPIMKNSGDKNIRGQSSISLDEKQYVSRFFIYLPFVLLTLIMIFFCGAFFSHSYRYLHLTIIVDQISYYSIIHSSLLSAFACLEYGIALSNNSDVQKNEIIFLTDIINDCQTKILHGSSTDFVNILNNYSFTFPDKCHYTSEPYEIIKTARNIIDITECTSLSLQIDWVVSLFRGFIEKNNSFSTFDSEEFSQIFFIILYNLNDQLSKFQSFAFDYSDVYHSDSHVLFYSSLSFIMAIICFFAQIYFSNWVQQTIKAGKQLLMLLPPNSLLKSYNLTSNILKFKMPLFINDSSDQSRTISELIIYEYSVAALLIKADTFVIQSVNPAFSNLTGYTQDQAIGQPIQFLFKKAARSPRKKSKEVQKKASFDVRSMHLLPSFNNLSESSSYSEDQSDGDPVEKDGSNPIIDILNSIMRRRDASSVSRNITFNSENKSAIYTKATIVPITSDTGEIIYFTIFLRDLSSENRQYEEALKNRDHLSSIFHSLMPSNLCNIFLKNEVNGDYYKPQTILIGILFHAYEDLLQSQYSKQFVESFNKVYYTIERVASSYPSLLILKEDSDFFLATFSFQYNQYNFIKQSQSNKNDIKDSHFIRPNNSQNILKTISKNDDQTAVVNKESSLNENPEHFLTADETNLRDNIEIAIKFCHESYIQIQALQDTMASYHDSLMTLPDTIPTIVAMSCGITIVNDMIGTIINKKSPVFTIIGDEFNDLERICNMDFNNSHIKVDESVAKYIDKIDQFNLTEISEYDSPNRVFSVNHV